MVVFLLKEWREREIEGEDHLEMWEKVSRGREKRENYRL